jgi:hypothetical protein
VLDRFHYDVEEVRELFLVINGDPDPITIRADPPGVLASRECVIECPAPRRVRSRDRQNDFDARVCVHADDRPTGHS